MLDVHEQYVFKCDQCDKEVTTFSEIKDHKESFHGNSEYACKKCNREGMSYKDYYDHVKDVHVNPNMFSCKLCDFGPVLYSQFKEHKYLEHGIKLFIATSAPCDQGEYLEESAGVLIQHNQPTQRSSRKKRTSKLSAGEIKHSYQACDICSFKGIRLSYSLVNTNFYPAASRSYLLLCVRLLSVVKFDICLFFSWPKNYKSRHITRITRVTDPNGFYLKKCHLLFSFVLKVDISMMYFIFGQ